MSAEKTSDRIPYHKLIEFTVVTLKDGKLRFIDLTGKAVNISASGLCFFTRYPLKAGCIVEFKDKVLQCRRAVVVWMKRAGDMYIIGARLLAADGLV
jgi:hypothetical protein